MNHARASRGTGLFHMKRMKRCNQCWVEKPVRSFAKRADGSRKQDCIACREKYKGWNKLTLEEKIARKGARSETKPKHRVRFIRRSGNAKLGPMPTTFTERGTCPPACMFYEMGCYADAGKLKGFWNEVPEKGIEWDSFLFEIERLPEKTIWRHAEAGDLPGEGNWIDAERLWELVRANRGRRGFTYTHKPLRTAEEWRLIRRANDNGFTINLSADSLEEADQFALQEAGPVVVTLEPDAFPTIARFEFAGQTTPKHPIAMRKTPGGQTLVLCPAQAGQGITCLSCQLCAVPTRKSVIVFLGHGQGARLIPELVRRKRDRAMP